MSTRGTWIRALLAIVLVAVPFLFFVSLMAYVFLARSRMADAQAQAERAAVMQAVSDAARRLKEQEALAQQRADRARMPGMAPPVVEEQAARRELQSHVVHITANFDGLGTALCEGLIVDRTESGAVVVVAPASVFAPKTGKLNGRVVTRKAGPISIGPSLIMGGGGMGGGGGGMGGMSGGAMGSGMVPGMGMGMPGGSGVTFGAETHNDLRELKGTGLVAFTVTTSLPPLRWLGELPQVVVGERLREIGHDSPGEFLAPPGMGDDSRVSVLGVHEQFVDGSEVAPKAPWTNLIRLSNGMTPLGTLLVNETNQPVAMIVAKRPVGDGQKHEAFAAPIDEVFRASLPFLERQDDMVAESTPDSAAARTAPADPEEERLDSLSRELAQRIRAATDDKKPDLLAELTKLLEQHFDHRQQRRQTEIDEVGARLENLRASHQKRQTDKAGILQRRLEELTDPQAERPWDEPK